MAATQPNKKLQRKTPFPELKNYLNKTLVVHMYGFRRIQGTLRGFDPFMNITMDDCVELEPNLAMTEQDQDGLGGSGDGEGGYGGHGSAQERILREFSYLPPSVPVRYPIPLGTVVSWSWNG
jgi:small nuclear ribonucleoprotein (snRNP)-like protein